MVFYQWATPSLFHEKPQIADKPLALTDFQLKGRVEFRDVHFHYNKDEPILKGVSFKLEPGRVCALVGHTGSGKSTTMASALQWVNENQARHVVTIEDPIEYVHQHKKSIINQREVGVDTPSFEIALKNTLRQAPDVIMIGEIRTLQTMDYAVAFAETGHLCLATLHANNANQALDRIINFFPVDRHKQVWTDLSLNLRGMVAQQLVPTIDGKGRRAAIEIMINSPLVSDLIRKGDVHALKEVMAKSSEQGMQTFDQALFNLYQEGQITYESALSSADSANDLRLLIKLSGGVETASLSPSQGLSLEGSETD